MVTSGAGDVRYAFNEEGWQEIYEERHLWIFKKLGAGPQSPGKVTVREEEDVISLEYSDGYGSLSLTTSSAAPDLGAVKDFIIQVED